MITIRDIETFETAPEGINLLVVRVQTSESGLYGLGCATFSYRHLSVQSVIETYLKPLLIGRDVSAITELWRLMHQNGYWRNGPVVNNAISGIDMALWDIKGKIANMPLYDLWGGKVRSGVPVYRHVEGKTPEEIIDKIEAYRAIGVKCIRCQMGGYGGGGYGPAPSSAAKGAPDGVYLDSRKYMRDTIHLFSEIRDKVGYDVDLVHDVHERISPQNAVVFTKEMEAFSLFFLEDVVSLEETQWLDRIREVSTTPLAIGELFNNKAEYKSLVEKRSIDYLRVHISQIGGITPARLLSQFAAEYGVSIAWHGPGDMSPIAHAANIHIDLTIENFGIQEWSGIEPPNFILENLNGVKGALLDVFPGMPEYGFDGFVYANNKPGLGIDFNEKEASKYPAHVNKTQWTQTRRRDGSLVSP